MFKENICKYLRSPVSAISSYIAVGIRFELRGKTILKVILKPKKYANRKNWRNQ